MKTDSEIRKDIEDELKWDARINGSKINVDVKEGHVILSGSIDSYPKKINAEKAVRRIVGIKSVSNDLKISIPGVSKRSDAEIKKTVFDSIKWNSSVKEDKINVEVKDGWVTLSGEVEWAYQKTKAKLLAEDIVGVTGVTNHINVVSAFFTNVQDVKHKINSALKRNHYLNSNKINVEVNGSTAILTGEVPSLAEKIAAETTAWSAPGIAEVINELRVDYSEIFV